MASIIKTPSGTWKAIIRKRGYPTTIKTFRTKRDADDWSRGVEDEMVRQVYVNRNNAERLTVAAALDRYQREVSPTKKASTQQRETSRFATLRDFFGAYSLAAVKPDLVGKFRDQRLAEGLASNTVRLNLALGPPVHIGRTPTFATDDLIPRRDACFWASRAKGLGIEVLVLRQHTQEVGEDLEGFDRSCLGDLLKCLLRRQLSCVLDQFRTVLGVVEDT
jgi:hypothetical protein